MLWLLIIISLSTTEPTTVSDAFIKSTHQSERSCRKEIHELIETFKRTAPQDIQLGCVPFKGVLS
jgi:hypothetical protein